MISFTLFRYLSWRLLSSVGGLFIAFTLLIMLIDFVENLRFAGKFADGSLLFALKITLMRSLSLTQLLSPFLFLFGTLWCFTQMSRRSELAVMRSAGVSVWSLLTPTMAVAVITGFVLIIVVDPLSADMMAQSERIKNEARGKRVSLVQFFNDGVWFRQRDGEYSTFINAKSINPEEGILGDPTIWRFGPNNKLIERIDSPEGFFRENYIELVHARLRKPEAAANIYKRTHTLPTPLSVNDLTEQVAKPETISIWKLKRFINLAEVAGLPTNKYYLRFYDLLSTPLKLLGMVLIAATFSMRPNRLGGTIPLVIFSIAAGFGVYIITAISKALGESGTVPLLMAAWTPAIAAILLALTGLLHLEEG